jgi:ribosomal protein S18 acetylase RimI-like enzyme
VVRAQLPPEQTQAFLEMQFHAQSQHYQNTFPNAQFSIVRDGDGIDIGRLYVDERPDETRILDIALLPEKRSTGIGTTLVKSIIEDSHSKGKPVRIHVEKNSREIGFYERLSFVKIGNIPSHDLMECIVPK